MNYNELIQLYFERSGALQSYWTLYVVIVGGLLAFSSLRKEPDLVTTSLISVLFICFAFKNMGAIEESSIQRLAVLKAIREMPAASAGNTKEYLDPTLNPPEVKGVRNFHMTSDFLTLITLWAMERRRRRTKN